MKTVYVKKQLAITPDHDAGLPELFWVVVEEPPAMREMPANPLEGTYGVEVGDDVVADPGMIWDGAQGFRPAVAME
jgi:hypothetical protein